MVSLNNILDHRDEILQIAARHGASNMRIFGSVVRGQAGEKSDVDVLVHLNDECSLLDHVGLMQDLEDLLGCKVDIVEDDSLHRSIRKQILSEAVSL